MRRVRPILAARDWIRVTLPHPGWSITPLVLYSAIEIINLFANPRGAQFECPGAGVLTVFAVIYGFYRVFYFHPLYRPDYRRWLMSVPWSVAHRLPLGPVHLVPQDFLIVGAMTAIVAWRVPQLSPIVVPICFFFSYTIGSIVSLGMLEHWTSAALIFALGALVRFTEQPWMAAAWLGAIYFITLIGYRQTLIDPATWDDTWWGKQGLSDNTGRPDQTMQERTRNNVLGWPWDFTSLKRNETPIPFLTGLIISVLIAWWVHALIFHLQRNVGGNVQMLYLIMVLPTGIVALARTGIYCWGQLPPISMVGRLVTFRWIIPGYDKVLIAPLTVLLLGWYGQYLLAQAGLEPQYGVPLLVFMIFLTALTMPPSLDDWKFTGNHRIANMVPAQPTEFVRTR
jgi:hypothetical protein